MTLVRSDTVHSGARLRAAVSVLVKTVQASEEFVYFRNSDYREPPADRGRSCKVHLAREDWEEMGRPDEITVTIEPGDMLNVDL